MTLIFILIIIFALLNIGLWYFLGRKQTPKESYHHVTVKFVGGSKTKLILNAEQYEQLKAFLNRVDGHFEIGDEKDSVKLYREHICAVEVKKK